MRQLTVDRGRAGDGSLVGTLERSATDPAPYEPVSVTRTRIELSPREVSELEELRRFATEGDGKQLYPNMIVPTKLFVKLAEVWR